MSTTNFDFLRPREPELWQLGAQAERYFHADPNTCLLKLRQFGEQLAQDVAERMGLHPQPGESQFELIGRLQRAQLVPYEVSDLLHKVRMVGNEANHAGSGDHRSALATLKLCWQLALWLHRSFATPGFKSGPFVPPQAGADSPASRPSITSLPPAKTGSQADAAVRQELNRLREQARSHQQNANDAQLRLQQAQQHTQAQQRAHAQALDSLTQSLSQVQREQAALQAALGEAQTEAQRWQAQARVPRAGAHATTAQAAAWRQAMDAAAQALAIDEFEARSLIDAQLREAGWQADSARLNHAQGTRPQAGAHIAIANWPLQPGAQADDANAWADYVLFAGEQAVGVVEAQATRIDLSACLPLAEHKARQLRALLASDGRTPQQAALPMVYAANGRPWAPSLPSKSGIWCRDTRSAQQLPHALAAFHPPQALLALAPSQAPQHALADLQAPNWRVLRLQPHQRDAIAAAEDALAQGQRRALLTLAPGTGKQRCAAALLLHLLAARRVQRVLWLDHDSTPLPATPTLLNEPHALCRALHLPDAAAALLPPQGWRVHHSSLGRMADVLQARRTPDWGVAQFDLVLALDNLPPGLQHTGASDQDLQAQLADASTVLGHFDCPAIGLAAAPTVHLQFLFGAPVFAYGVAQAVVDGVRQDHAPPEVLHTQLSVAGVWLPAGQALDWLDPASGRIDTQAPAQALSFELEDFNRRVIVTGHTQAVCEALARQIEPEPTRKTIVCCVDADHADRVALALKPALLRAHAGLPESAVLRIDADLPEAPARWQAFTQQAMPLVAVSAHSLALWPASAAVHTLVLLRREDSLLWLDQWCSRAARAALPNTRTVFRIIDAANQHEPSMRWMDAAEPAYSADSTSTGQNAAHSATAHSAALQTSRPPSATAATPSRGKRRKGKARASMPAQRPVAPAPTAPTASTQATPSFSPRLTALVAELVRADDQATRQRLAQLLASGIAPLHAQALPLTRELLAQACGLPLPRLPAHLLDMPTADLPDWWRARPGLAELLDALAPACPPATRLPICTERDLLLDLRPSWGDAAVWQDERVHWQAMGDAAQLLASAQRFTQVLWQRALADAPAPAARPSGPTDTADTAAWRSPALLAALRDWVQQPQHIAPEAARTLAVALHQAGYSEARLAAAWAAVHGRACRPQHGGWVRHWLANAALLDHAQRCEQAHARLLRQPWTSAQREAIAALHHSAQATLVPSLGDWATPRAHETLAQAEQRLNQLFAPGADAVLQAYRDAMWVGTSN